MNLACLIRINWLSDFIGMSLFLGFFLSQDEEIYVFIFIFESLFLNHFYEHLYDINYSYLIQIMCT